MNSLFPRTLPRVWTSTSRAVGSEWPWPLSTFLHRPGLASCPQKRSRPGSSSVLKVSHHFGKWRTPPERSFSAGRGWLYWANDLGSFVSVLTARSKTALHRLSGKELMRQVLERGSEKSTRRGTPTSVCSLGPAKTILGSITSSSTVRLSPSRRVSKSFCGPLAIGLADSRARARLPLSLTSPNGRRCSSWLMSARDLERGPPRGRDGR